MLRRVLLILGLGVGIWGVGGCMGSVARGPRVVAHPLLLEPGALDELTTAYADRYVLLISAAADGIKERVGDVGVKHLAQRLKTESAVSVYDIVTSGDAYGRLLDLTVAVTLQSEVYIDEDGAEATFGKENAAGVIRAMRQARLEIWEIAAKALSQEQLENLDLMIWQYRRANPTLPSVINVRFNDFANSKSKAFIADASAGGILTQIDEARRSVDEARRLAERAFFYGKRAPLLLSWQAETNADEMLAKPELKEFLGDVHRFGALAEGLPGMVAEERKAILTAFDERQKTLGETLAQTKETLGEADALAKSGQETLRELQKTMGALEGLMRTADGLAGKYMPPPPPAGTQMAATSTQPVVPARPFDVREYTAALAQATEAVKELDGVLMSSQNLLGSPAWAQRVNEIQKTADDRMRLAEAQSETLVSSIFVKVYWAIGALFLALVIYKLISVVLVRKAEGGKC